jgi:Putative auto-transporter adhesin, head GIN domain
MMRLKYFLPYVLFVTFCLMMVHLSSCKKDHMLDCFKGTGDEVTETRNLSGFSMIECNDNVNVVIAPGSAYKVTVTAGKKIIDGITTTIENNQLVIANQNKCNWVRSFKNKFTVSVSLPELTAITNWGSGNITTTDTIRTNELHIDNHGGSGAIKLLMNIGSCRTNVHTGVADFNYTGHIGVHYFYHNGNGPFNTLQCQCDVVFTENKGTNDSYIYATKLLEAKTSYVGNIYYKGNPDSLKLTQLDKGKIIRID